MKRLVHYVALLVLALPLIGYSQGQNPDPILDSTTIYHYESGVDSIPAFRSLYTQFNEGCYPETVVLYLKGEEEWQEDGIQTVSYDQEGRIIVKEESYANPTRDIRTEFHYSGGLLESEVRYEKSTGSEEAGEWIPVERKKLSYDIDGSLAVVHMDAYFGYWQALFRLDHSYVDGKLARKDKTMHFPHPEVKVFHQLYGETEGGQVFEFDPVMILGTATYSDLDGIVLGDEVDFLNVYINDGVNKRLQLHGVAGKTLAAVLQGENDENAVVDLGTLRQDYLEWLFSADMRYTLLNINIKGGRYVNPHRLVEVKEGLTSENSQGHSFDNTVYRVKSVTSMADLDSFTIEEDVDWVNIYLSEDPDDPDANYYRVDIVDAAGKSLRTICEENDISIRSLSQDYFEWFRDSTENPALEKVNIKAVRMDVSDDYLLKVYKDLYNSGETEDLRMTGYKIHPDADMEDLANDTVEADTDLLNVYLADGDSYERVDLKEVSGKSLKDVLSGDNKDKVIIDLAQLKDDYLEWFYDADGRIHLYNVNVKSSHSTGIREAVKVTKGLNASGSDIQKVTAFLVHDWSTLDDLEEYVLTGIDFINVYAMEGLDKVRYSLTGIEGNTLKAVLNGDNTEGIIVSLDNLRTHYFEWFRDDNENPALVNLNIKAVEEMGPAPRVVVTPDLIGSSGANDEIYGNTTYLVESFATDVDLEDHVLPNDISWLNVYATEGTDKVRYDLTGVAGKTLDEALSAAGNDQGIDIALSELRHDYFEWFADTEGSVRLVNLNMKATKQISDIDRLKERKDYAYADEMLTSVISTYYDDGGVQEGDMEKVEYGYSGGMMILEEYFASPDGSTWNPLAKQESAYTPEGEASVISSFVYDNGYELSTREFFGYAVVDQTISSKDQVCEDVSIDMSFMVEDEGGLASVQAVYPEGVSGSVDYSSPIEVGQSGVLTETLSSTNSTPQTVSYTFTSTATCIQDPGVESVEVIVNPTPVFGNLPAETDIASGEQLDFVPTGDVDGTVFSWTSTVSGEVSGNTANGEGGISDVLLNSGSTDGTVSYNFTAAGPTGCVHPETADYVVTVAAATTGIGVNDPSSVLKVYPNPVRDVLHVSMGSQKSFDYRLYNISGKMIMSGTVADGTLNLDVSGLTEGMYMLKVILGNTEFSRKFMK